MNFTFERFKRYLFSLFFMISIFGLSNKSFAKSYNEITYKKITKADINKTFASEVYFSSTQKGSEFNITIDDIYTQSNETYFKFTSTKEIQHINSSNNSEEDKSWIEANNTKMTLVSEENRTYIFSVDSIDLNSAYFTLHLVHGNNIVGGNNKISTTTNNTFINLKVTDATGEIVNKQLTSTNEDKVYEENKILKGSSFVDITGENSDEASKMSLKYKIYKDGEADSVDWKEVTVYYDDTSDVILSKGGYLTHRSYNVDKIPGVNDDVSQSTADTYWKQRSYVFEKPFNSIDYKPTTLSTTKEEFGKFEDIPTETVTQYETNEHKEIFKRWNSNSVFLTNLFISNDYREASKFWGYIKVPKDGKYYFGMFSDDGNRGYIIVDGEEIEIADSFKLQGSTYSSSNNTFELKADKYYPIYLEYFNWGGSADFRLWYGNSRPEKQVPSTWFYPSKSTYPGEYPTAKFYGNRKISMPTEEGVYYIATKLELDSTEKVSGITGPFEIINYDSLTVKKEFVDNDGSANIGDEITIRYTITPKNWNSSKGFDNMEVSSIKFFETFPDGIKIINTSQSNSVISNDSKSIESALSNISYTYDSSTETYKASSVSFTVTIQVNSEKLFTLSEESTLNYTDVDGSTQNQKEFDSLTLDSRSLTDAEIEIEEDNTIEKEWYLGSNNAPDYNLVVKNPSSDAAAYLVLYEYDYSKSDLTEDPNNDLENKLSNNKHWGMISNTSLDLSGSVTISASDTTQNFTGNSFVIESGRNIRTSINLTGDGIVKVEDSLGSGNTIKINAGSGNDTVFFNEISGANNNYNGGNGAAVLLLGKSKNSYTISDYTNNNGLISATIKDNSTNVSLRVKQIEQIIYNAGNSDKLTLPIDSSDTHKYDGKYIIRRVLPISSSGVVRDNSGNKIKFDYNNIEDLFPTTDESKLTYYVDTKITQPEDSFNNITATDSSTYTLTVGLPDDFNGIKGIKINKMYIVSQDTGNKSEVEFKYGDPSDSSMITDGSYVLNDDVSNDNINIKFSSSSVSANTILDIQFQISDVAGNTTTFNKKIYLADKTATITYMVPSESSAILKPVSSSGGRKEFDISFSVVNNYKKINSYEDHTPENVSIKSINFKIDDMKFANKKNPDNDTIYNVTIPDSHNDYEKIWNKTSRTLHVNVVFEDSTTTEETLDVTIAESDKPVISNFVITNETLKNLITGLKDDMGNNFTDTSLYQTSVTDLSNPNISFSIKDGDEVTISFDYTDQNYKTDDSSNVNGVTITGNGVGIRDNDGNATEEENNDSIYVIYTFVVDNNDKNADGINDDKQIDISVSDKFDNIQTIQLILPLDNTSPDSTLSLSPTGNIDNNIHYLNENYSYNFTNTSNDIIAYGLIHKHKYPNDILNKISDDIYYQFTTLTNVNMPVDTENHTYDGKYDGELVAIDKAGNISKSGLVNNDGTIQSSAINYELIHYLDTENPNITDFKITKNDTGYETYKENDTFTLSFTVSDENLSSIIKNDNTTYYEIIIENSGVSGLKINLTANDMTIENGKIKFSKTISLSNITGDSGEFKIKIRVMDLAGNISETSENTIAYDNRTPANITLSISGTNGDRSDEIDSIVNSNNNIIVTKGDAYFTNIRATTSNEENIPLNKAIFTFIPTPDSGENTINSFTGSSGLSLNSGITNIKSLRLITQSGLIKEVSSTDPITLNGESERTLSDVKIIKDNKIDTDPNNVAEIPVSFVSGNKYSVKLDFSGVLDYTGIYKIILENIKIKGKVVDDILVSIDDGKNYKAFSELEESEKEFTNSNLGVSLDSLLGRSMVSGYSKTLYIDITNNQDFIGSRVTFEIDIEDGVGNTWSSRNGNIEYDTFFPKQALELKGRIEGSNRQKTSKIKVVGDGSGSKFNIQKVEEGGQEEEEKKE